MRTQVASFNGKKDDLSRRMEQVDAQLAGLPRSGRVRTETGQAVADLKNEQAGLKKTLVSREQQLKALPKEIALLEIALQAAEKTYDAAQARHSSGAARQSGQVIRAATQADAASETPAAAGKQPEASPARRETGAAMRQRLTQELIEKKSEFAAAVKQNFERSDREFDESFPGIRQHPGYLPYHLTFAREAQGRKRVGEEQRTLEQRIVFAAGLAYDTSMMLSLQNLFEVAWKNELSFDKRIAVGLGITTMVSIVGSRLLPDLINFTMLASHEFPLQLEDIKEQDKHPVQERLNVRYAKAEQRLHELDSGGDKGKMFDMVKNDVGLAQAMLVYANILAPEKTGVFIHSLQKGAWRSIEKAIKKSASGDWDDSALLEREKLEKHIRGFADQLKTEPKKNKAGDNQGVAHATQDLARFFEEHEGKIAEGITRLLARFSADFKSNQKDLLQELKEAGGKQEPATPSHGGNAGSAETSAWSVVNFARAAGMGARKSSVDTGLAKKAAAEDFEQKAAAYRKAQKTRDEIEDELPALRRQIAEIEASLTQVRAGSAAQRNKLQAEKHKLGRELKNLDAQSLDWLRENPHARTLIEPWALERVLSRHTLAADEGSDTKKMADRLPFPKDRESRNVYETHFSSGLDLLDAILMAQEQLGPKNGNGGTSEAPFEDRYLNCGRIIGTAYRREAGDRLGTSGIQVSMNANHVITHLHPYAPRIWETAG